MTEKNVIFNIQAVFFKQSVFVMLEIFYPFACSFYFVIFVSVIHENIVMVFVPSWYICHIHICCVSSGVKLN